MARKFQDSCAYPPRMMNADRAAAYLDLSKTKFLEGVQSGKWPAPRDADGVPRWHRLDLDAASDATDSKEKRLASGRKSLADMMEAEGTAGGAQ
jgi:hypothetical protein